MAHGPAADIGLRHAELVYAVADRTQGLVKCHGFQPRGFVRRETGDIAQLAGVTPLRFAHGKLRKVLGKQIPEFCFVFRAREHKFQVVAAHDARPEDNDFLFLSQPPQILSGNGQGIGDGPVRFHAKREVYAPLEIKPEGDFPAGQNMKGGDHRHVRQSENETQNKNKQGNTQTPAQSHSCIQPLSSS